jgi:hypothetical protein
MPGTGSENRRGSIRWKHECHVTLNAWKSAVNRPHLQSLHLRCSVLHFKSSRESGHAWYWCKEWPTECLRETENVMSHWIHGHQQWNKPGSFLYISCDLHSTSRALKNHGHAWYRCKEPSREYSLEIRNVMSHLIHEYQQWNKPKSHLYIVCALYYTLEVFNCQEHAWYRCRERSRECSL